MVSTEVLTNGLAVEAEARTRELGEKAVTDGAALGLELLLEHGQETGQQILLSELGAKHTGMSTAIAMPEAVTPPIAYRGIKVQLRGGVRKEFGQKIVGVVSVEPIDMDGEGTQKGALAYATGFESGVAQRSVLVRNGQPITIPGWQIGVGMMMGEIAEQFGLPRPDLPPGTVFGVRKG